MPAATLETYYGVYELRPGMRNTIRLADGNPEFTSISQWFHRRFTPVPQSVHNEDRNDFTRETV